MLKLINCFAFADGFFFKVGFSHQQSLLILRLAMQPQPCIRHFRCHMVFGCLRLFLILYHVEDAM